MPGCRVCAHPQREAIDRALCGHGSRRALGREYGLTEPSLRRHAAHHLSAALVKAAERRGEQDAGTLLERMETLERETLAMLEREKAKNGKADPRIVLACIREQRGNLELLGRLRGELVTGATIQVLMRYGVRDEREMEDLLDSGRRLRRLSENSEAAHDEWLASSLRLLKFLLREHPDWRPRVLEQLGVEVAESD